MKAPATTWFHWLAAGWAACCPDASVELKLQVSPLPPFKGRGKGGPVSSYSHYLLSIIRIVGCKITTILRFYKIK